MTDRTTRNGQKDQEFLNRKTSLSPHAINLARLEPMKTGRTASHDKPFPRPALRRNETGASSQQGGQSGRLVINPVPTASFGMTFLVSNSICSTLARPHVTISRRPTNRWSPSRSIRWIMDAGMFAIEASIKVMTEGPACHFHQANPTRIC